MTTWLLGRHPGRFAAAVSENPVLDLFSFYGRVRLRIHDREALGGSRSRGTTSKRMLDRRPAPSCTE
jgi:dipeptidyl aminopeptidase/acylaminoacyl peptidase